MSDIVEIGLVVRDKGLKESITAVTRLERQVTAASKAVEKGTITQDRYNKILLSAKREYQKLGVSSQKSTAVVRKFADEQRRLATEARNASQVMAKGYAAAGRTLNDTSSRVRQSFLNTANSIAILDGPLGGVASRFSAFGVLIGRTGILLGVALAGFSALGVVVSKSVKAFMEYEVQMAKINGILQTTGGQAGLTASEIESMASRIALATLESEQSIRAAATQLLTFKNVGKDVFETTLKAATDMAALGFGTVESEAVKLAKALEDPRQSLTSLSRSGITFTRQQRQLITSLVESGRQAEAMERILDNVNKQVGGAGEAAARDTMAGSFDTIGQAVGRAAREVGEFVTNSLGLRYAVSAVANAVGDFAGGQSPIEEAIDNLEELRKRSAAWFSISGGMAPILAELPTDLPENVERAVRGARSYQEALSIAVDYLKETNLEMQRLASATAAASQLSSRSKALDNLQAQTDALRENIGLTEQQIRVNSMLAAEGMFNVDIAEEVRKYRDQLIDAGKRQEEVNQLVRDFEDVLLDGVIAAEELAAAIEAAADGRAFMRNLETLDQQNALIELQLELMDDGLSSADARIEAEYRLQLAQAETLKRAGLITDEAYEQLAVAIAINKAKGAELADRIKVERESGRSPRASSGGSTREPTDIADIISKMEQEIANKNTLLNLQGDEIRFQEILFDLKEKNAAADIKMTEENLRLAAARMRDAENVNKAMEEAIATQEALADTISKSMGDAFTSMVDGTMTVTEAFRNMARQIIKHLWEIFVVEQLVNSVKMFMGGGPVGMTTGPSNALGGMSGAEMLPSYAGGGFTGGGPRSGGVDGKGGFPAILHPRETVVDHTKGQSTGGGGDNIVINQSFNFSANGDESVRKIIAEAAPQIANMTQQKMMDQRRRGGAMKSTFG